MKIKEIMTKKVTYVSPETNVSDVADIIFKNNFHAVPVVENKKVLGIITEDDFFLKNYDDLFLPSYIKFVRENHSVENLPDIIKEKIKKFLSAKARDIMSSNVITASEDMDTQELMLIMKKTKFTVFPAVDLEKNMTGIVTLADILGIVRKGAGQMGRSMRRRGELKEIENLTKEIHSYWKDNLVLMSRKKVKTWKGMLFIGTAVILVGIIASFYITSSKSSCELTNEVYAAPGCLKFTYSDWGPCLPSGIQARQVTEKFPQNCSGGAIPEISRKCQ